MMRMIVALVVLLAGVAAAQDATLYIVNDSKGSGFAMRPLTLKVLDGRTELASIKNHQTVKVNIKPGVHGLALKIANKDITVLTAKAGETYFLRVLVDQGLAYAGTRCVLVKPEEAVNWVPEAQRFVKDTPPAPATPAPQPPPVMAVPGPAAVPPVREIVDSNADSSQSLGEAARRVKQHKACLELAKADPSVTCK